MDDTDRQNILYALLAAGWVVILYHFFLNGLMFGTFSYGGLVISLLLAGIVGAGVFFGMKKMQG